MHKLVALYATPADADAFLARYREGHLPLVAKIPGLLRVEVTQLTRTLAGVGGNFLLAEMYFADAASLKAALKSPEAAATTVDVASFADGLATVMTGEVLDL